MAINKQKQDVVHISIPNWEKYNPRSDRSNYNWFRMQNDFFVDQGVFILRPIEKLVLVFLICEFSKKNGQSAPILLNYVTAFMQISREEALEIFQSLEDSGLICCDFGDLLQQNEPLINLQESSTPLNGLQELLRPLDVSKRRPTNERTNERNGTNVTERDERDGHVSNSADAEPAAPELPKLHPLAEIWNQWCGTLPKAISSAGKRRVSAEARWKERPEEEYWVSVTQRIAGSSFCAGQGSTGWRATFDWFLKPDTHVRAMEGKYDDVDRIGKKSQAQQSADHGRDQLARIRRGEL